MPMLEIRAPYLPPEGLLADIAQTVARSLNISSERVSVFWNQHEPSTAYHVDWDDTEAGGYPVITISCRDVHPSNKVREALVSLVELLRIRLPNAGHPFVAVRRMAADEIHAYGKLWE